MDVNLDLRWTFPVVCDNLGDRLMRNGSHPEYERVRRSDVIDRSDENQSLFESEIEMTARETGTK